jgi:hypothetical protein
MGGGVDTGEFETLLALSDLAIGVCELCWG